MAGTTISGLQLAIPGAAKGALTASDLTSKLINQLGAAAKIQSSLGTADLKKSLLEQKSSQGFISQEVANMVGQPNLASDVSITDAINRGITSEVEADKEKQAGLDALSDSKFLKLKLAEGQLAEGDGGRTDEELKAQALSEATTQLTAMKVPLPSGLSIEDINKSVLKNISEGLGLSLAEVAALQKQETRSSLGNLSLAERTLINSRQRQEATAQAATKRVATRGVEKSASDIVRDKRDIQSDVDSLLSSLARDGRKAFRSGRRDINVQRANSLIQRMIDSGEKEQAVRFKENFESSSGGKATLQDIPNAGAFAPRPGRSVPPPRQAPRKQQTVPQPPPVQEVELSPEEVAQVKSLEVVSTTITANIKKQKVQTIKRSRLEDLIITGARGRVGAPSRKTINSIINSIVKTTGVKVID